MRQHEALSDFLVGHPGRGQHGDLAFLGVSRGRHGSLARTLVWPVARADGQRVEARARARLSARSL